MNLSKNYFYNYFFLFNRIYRSKEAFLMLQNPITKISLFHILDTNRVNISTNMNTNKKKIYNFYIEFNEKVLNHEYIVLENLFHHSNFLFKMNLF